MRQGTIRLARYFFATLVVLAAVAVILLQWERQVIKADMVWGTGKNVDRYHMINPRYEYIAAEAEQIGDMADSSYVNVSYVVVYEERRWRASEKKALRTFRFERPFPEEALEPAGTGYYKLVEELLNDIDGKHSLFVRLFERRDGNHHLFGLEPSPIVVPRTSGLQEARTWIQQYEPEFLALPSRTVVEEEVRDDWSEEGYVPSTEYHFESPEGLSVQAIIEGGSARASDGK
ncbi:hypothetical protein MO973_11685 [Paenibacillus sp. TRM 82003]|nr:hypothetical protein [Paenibacillus sp. TRM 82003]